MLFLAALLLAQTAPQQCTAMDTGLPAALAAWTTPGDGDPGDLTKPLVLMSRTPEDQARLDAMPPPRPMSQAEMIAAVTGDRSKAAQTGGMARIAFRIDKAGTYGIALDQPGWIDVAVKDGTPLKTAGHGHGPACSTISKIVRFDLQPGLYELKLSKLTKPKAKVMLVADE
jgi:hypothetical protein